jgi:hypothetical protein
MTECNQSGFGFEACGSREIVARFDGGTISSDGGAFLLRQTNQRLNLLPRLAECFLDGRNQEQVEHSILEMLSQRIYGLALGYEDINDHEQLRKDPVFGILAGRKELEEPLAGKSTLNRMELGAGTKDRYKKITFWKEAIDVLRLAASKMLRRIGLSVIEASDGSAALDLIRAHKERINAVLLDITLPGASSRTSEMNHNQRWLLADGLIGLAMLFGALLLLLTFSSARLP